MNNDIPAVLYGGGEDPVSLTIAHKDIAKATENEAFFSHIITLNVGKKKQKAVIKALQRHPAKAILMHADFQRVSDKVQITVNVPIHFLNEDKCAGVKTGGGSIIKTLNEIEIHCFPKDLPEFIEVDMILLEIGEAVHLADITLPAGVASVALAADNNLTVATVQAPRAEVEEAAAAPDAPAAPESEASGDDSEEKED